MGWIGDWKKGGLRYRKLKRIVPSYLEPAELHGFFVGVPVSGGTLRLANPFTPLFQREYVIAATSDGVSVLRLRLPGVFRASISGRVYEQSGNDPEVRWDGQTFVVGGESYRPIAYHDEDAALVAEGLSR
jgi:hypothetical protein